MQHSIILKKLLDKDTQLPLLNNESNVSLIQYFDENKKGCDYVVGDIHNQFNKLSKQLKALDFDVSKDRLFAVGDLIDRGDNEGNNGLDVLSYLSQDWFHSLRGNHEDLILSLLSLPEKSTQTLYDLALKNGAKWLFDADAPLKSDLYQYGMNETNDIQNELTFEQLMHEHPLAASLYSAFIKLPLIIQIGKNIAMVHAEVPLEIKSWSEVKDKVMSQDPDMLDSLVWGRERVDKDINVDIAGISVIFCGHSIHQQAENYGNHRVIDTGAYAREENLLHIEKIDYQYQCTIDKNVRRALAEDDFVNYHDTKSFSYVRLEEMSEENKELFECFVIGRSRPIIDGEGKTFFKSDYQEFLSLKESYLKKYHGVSELIIFLR